MKKPITLAILCSLFVVDLALANFLISKPIGDTAYVKLKGKIIELETHIPLGATIIYQSLPYGGEMGIIQNNKLDGTYELQLRPNTSYKIEIKCKGHGKKKFEMSMQVSDKEHDFVLSPVSDDALIRLESLTFDESKADILPESYKELDELIEIMLVNASMEIQLEGHTDHRGSAEKNMQLSEERVKAVKVYLTERGIKKKRIKTVAFGGQKPLTKKDTPEARALNRRVEVRVIKE